ncbi:MAG: thiaminase II [candidate division NC10 bacterium]|nr:thiaminase II [candidate division NC10 bacterium]
MSFSELLWKKAEPIWQKTLHHPFVQGIGDGTLEVDKFKFYIRQDYIFLVEYSRVLALAAAKGSDLATMGKFAELLHATLNTEMALHRGYAEKFGIGRNELEQTKPAPTAVAYTRHLLGVAALGSLSEIVASLLPCQWGYCEIGSTLAKQGEPKNQPLYGEWIRTYASPEFAALAQWIRALLDSLGESAGAPERARMEECFLLSARYEHAFWDMSWRLEAWPV